MTSFEVDTLKQQFSVPFEYTVAFTHQVFAPENPALRDVLLTDGAKFQGRVLFVLEESLLKDYPTLPEDITAYCETHTDIIKPASLPHIIAGGETLKMPKPIVELCDLFNQNALCRHSYVCIVGGGAFLDAVGFAASIVHRGIRQIRFPTTVLSQNDSGVGVKTAINMYEKKNFVGTFAPPFAVINDFCFLDTLSDRDWVAGIPEAFKVSMIKDAEFFHWLCEHVEKLKNRDAEIMEHLIKRCAELHLQHIATAGDPFEFGSARPLDFGHWSAHKLEMLTDGGLRHGEAVAIGLVLDTFYAVEKGLISEEFLQKLQASFLALGLPLWDDTMLPDNDGNYPLIDGIEEFREHLGGELHITLPEGLGCKTEVGSLDEETIRQGIAFLQKLEKTI